MSQYSNPDMSHKQRDIVTSFFVEKVDVGLRGLLFTVCLCQRLVPFSGGLGRWSSYLRIVISFWCREPFCTWNLLINGDLRLPDLDICLPFIVKNHNYINYH